MVNTAQEFINLGTTGQQYREGVQQEQGMNQLRNLYQTPQFQQATPQQQMQQAMPAYAQANPTGAVAQTQANLTQEQKQKLDATLNKVKIYGDLMTKGLEVGDVEGANSILDAVHKNDPEMQQYLPKLNGIEYKGSKTSYKMTVAEDGKPVWTPVTQLAGQEVAATPKTTTLKAIDVNVDGIPLKASFDSQTNAYYYPNSSQRIEGQITPIIKGKGTTSGGTDGGGLVALSDNAVNFLSEIKQQGLNIRDVIPAFGMGKEAQRERMGFIEKIATKWKNGDWDIGNVKVAASNYKSDSQTLTVLKKQQGAIEAFENTALKNFEYAINSGKDVKKSSVPFLNKIFLEMKNQMGDEGVAKFRIALSTASQETAKVLSGGTLSAAASSDSAREEMARNLSETLNDKQLKAVYEALKYDMTQRKQSLRQQIMDTQNRIKSPNGMEQTGNKEPATTQAHSPAPTAQATVNERINGLSDADRKALRWANQNKNDPRASEIHKRLGI